MNSYSVFLILARLIPEIPASDLYSCEKAGYLDKKKRGI